MYEPKHSPSLDQSVSLPSGMRFGISHLNDFIRREDPNADPLHIHNYLEIFFNLSSDASFLVNNTLYPVQRGEAVLSRPNDIHVCIFNKAALHEHICLWIDTDFDQPIFSFLRQADFCPLYTFESEEEKSLRDALFALLNACQKEHSALEKTAYLWQILSFFEERRPSDEKKPSSPVPLQNVLDDIQENFAEIHHIGDLLSRHFVSSATLTRYFRKYLHTSPREYLESVRLSHAAAMLSRGATVTEACMKSGFFDCSYFIVLFKKRFGVTPLQYKKALK